MAKKKRAFDPDTAAKYLDAAPDLDPEGPHLESILLLYEIARIAGGGFHPADGWPDALTARELARLQFPDDQEKQADFCAVVWRRLGVDIEAVTVMRPHRDDAGNWHHLPEGGIARNVAANLLKELGLTPIMPTRAWFASGGVDSGASSESDSDKSEDSKRASRARDIVKTLEAMGKNPKALPPTLPGKAGIKRECRNKLIGKVETDGAMTFKQFDDAWEWAITAGRLVQPKQ